MRTAVVGLLLAAGRGARMGRPKALVSGADEVAWVLSSTRRLHDAGCAAVRVVLGAEATVAEAVLVAGLDEPVDIVVAHDWADGMAASLRAGLLDLDRLAPGAGAALVHLVDLPDVGADVIRRVAARSASGRADVLARAAYAGVPGHPVLLGQTHWTGVAASATGDHGARGYLAGRAVEQVECGDLATGADVDRPPAAGASARARGRDE